LHDFVTSPHQSLTSTSHDPREPVHPHENCPSFGRGRSFRLTGVWVMRGILLSSIALVAVATSGCGDGMGSTGTGGVGAVGGGGGAGGTGGSVSGCGRASACGGGVVGTWAIIEVCNLTVTTPDPGICAGVQYAGSTLTETGTFTFRTDGTVTEDLTGTGMLHEVVPSSCFDVLGTCAQIDANFQMAVGQGTYTSGSCASAASGSCECTAAFNTTATVSGMYTTSGSTLTLMNTTNTSTSDSYCVQGSTLVISVPNTTGAPPAIYVLSKH